MHLLAARPAGAPHEPDRVGDDELGLDGALEDAAKQIEGRRTAIGSQLAHVASSVSR
jgi:hypothetical protein